MKAFEEVIRPKDFKKFGFHKCFVNDNYMVDVRMEDGTMDGLVWLSIKRKDKNWMRDWRELQRIKNAICGEEREGCELYPAESRLVDSSNQFHIFVLPKGDYFPFGYKNRFVVEGHKGGWNKGSNQRPFKIGQEPKDVLTVIEAKQMEKEYQEKMHDE